MNFFFKYTIKRLIKNDIKKIKSELVIDSAIQNDSETIEEELYDYLTSQKELIYMRLKLNLARQTSFKHSKG